MSGNTGNGPTPDAPLVARLEAGEARIGVVGLGYVGLGLALALAEAGLRVVGLDTDPERVRSVGEARSGLQDAPPERIRPLLDAGHLEASTDEVVLRECDVVLVCVPTPLRKSREPDISFILAALGTLQENLRPGTLVVLESTTFPGTTEEILRPALEKQGFTVGEDIFLAFSPERVDPGNRTWTLRNTPKLVGGCTSACRRAASALYRKVSEEVVPVSSPATAEMAKILENTFRAVNIALANEVALICERLGLDVWEVVDAAATKPYGFMPFRPGPGLGGHCIPVDPLYLTWKLRFLDYVPRLIELADQVNREMPDHVVHLVSNALNDEGKPIKGSRVAVLGVAYKADVSDTRESPALRIVQLLREGGAEVACHDPHVETFRLEDGTEVTCEPLGSALEGADATLVLTAHAAFDAEEILERSRVLVDARNLTSGIDDPRIRRLGDRRSRDGEGR